MREHATFIALVYLCPVFVGSDQAIRIEDFDSSEVE